ncbi:MAG: DMT family transporter [Spirochaetales bacterium]|nr:DMT family transporter [Spirochaetales bacterium]
MHQEQDYGRRRALTFLTFGILSFGFSGVLIKLCRFPSPVVASFRMILAGAVLTPFCIPAWRRLLGQRGVTEVMILLVPGVLLGLHFHAWVAGLKLTSVASATFIFSINPVFFALGERFLRRRRVPPHALVSLALVVAGAGWLLFAKQESQGGTLGDGGSLYGDLLCLVATLLFVVYLFVSRWVTQSSPQRGGPGAGTSPFRVPHHLYIHIVYLGGGLATLPLALVGGQLGGVSLGDGASVLALVGLALFPTLIGHTANNYGVRFLPPLTVSFFTLAEPVLATIAAALILDEIPGLRELPTYALFLAATVCYLVRSRGRPLDELPTPRSRRTTSGRRTDSSR